MVRSVLKSCSKSIMNTAKINIKALTRDELQGKLVEQGLKKYRADQVFDWIYAHHAGSFEEMTNISRPEREALAARFVISMPNITHVEVSSDGTRKFLFSLEDNHTI